MNEKQLHREAVYLFKELDDADKRWFINYCAFLLLRQNLRQGRLDMPVRHILRAIPGAFEWAWAKLAYPSQP